MPVFRKRRARAGAPAEAPKPIRPRPPALADRLARIAAEAAAPEEALELALRAVLEESGAHAGALCLFDPRQAVLRLAVERGLSDEGCRRLRTVRRGDPTTWDMPLHGLMNGRAYLIESAARNRYVPRLVEPAASVRTVACVPLNAGPLPVGSLILVAVAPRSFGERDIRALEPALGHLAGMIEAARRRRRATETAGSVESSAATAGLVAARDRLIADHERLAAELAARTSEVERLGSALDTAAADRARLTADLEGARRTAEQVTPHLAYLLGRGIISPGTRPIPARRDASTGTPVVGTPTAPPSRRTSRESNELPESGPTVSTMLSTAAGARSSSNWPLMAKGTGSAGSMCRCPSAAGGTAAKVSISGARSRRGRRSSRPASSLPR